MQVFISWSGTRSKTLAVHVHEWIKTVVQRAEPWMSERDIEAGQRWNAEISTRLKDTDFGIICLTPENLNAPWLLFEAGALAKALETARVVPLLFGLGKADLTFPLAQFQAVEADRDGFFLLASAVNKALPDGQLETTLLNNIFNGLWANFEITLQSLRDTPSDSPTQNRRSDREVLEDVLEGVRSLQRNAGPSTAQSRSGPLSDWEDYYIRGVNLANKRGGPETDNAALRSYAQAIAIAPLDLPQNTMSRLYAYQAAILKRLGRLEEAKNGLLLAQQLASEDREIADAMYNMACVLAMNGDADGAIAHLRKLIEHDSGWAPIIASKSYFRNISDHPEFKVLTKNAD